MRLLLVLLVLVLLWLLFLRLSAWLVRDRGGARRGNGPRPVGPGRDRGAAPAAGRDRGGEPLVRCAACGVHVPRSRALAGPRPIDRGPYCSDACRRRSGDGPPAA